MIKLGLPKKKNISNISEMLEDLINKSTQNSLKTFVLVKFAHKDKKITYHVCELKGDIVELNGIAYYISTDNLYTFEYVMNKKKYKIVMVDVYEGITTGFNPLEDRLSQVYNETVQKAIYLYLQTNIMENKLKQKTKMKTIIIAAILGFGALFIILKMFGK